MRAADSARGHLPEPPGPPPPAPFLPRLFSIRATLSSPNPASTPSPLRNPHYWLPQSRLPATLRPPPSARPRLKASITHGVSAQTCPQSLPNPRTQPQVRTAPGACAELRGWVSAHPSPHIPARSPPRRAALLRGWDAGLPRKTYGRYRAGSQMRGRLPRIQAQLACGTFLDQLVKTLRASVSLSVKWGFGGSVLRGDEDGRESEDISIAEPSRALPSRPHIGS